MGTEQQDVGRHQHRITEQSHGHTGILVLAGRRVGVGRGLVRMGAIHQALGGHAGDQPIQFQRFRHITLAIEISACRIKTCRQPRHRHFQRRAADAFGVVTLDQTVIIGEKQEGIDVLRKAGLNGGANRAHVVSQVRDAGGGDTGQDTLTGWLKIGRHGRAQRRRQAGRMLGKCDCPDAGADSQYRTLPDGCLGRTLRVNADAGFASASLAPTVTFGMTPPFPCLSISCPLAIRWASGHPAHAHR